VKRVHASGDREGMPAGGAFYHQHIAQQRFDSLAQRPLKQGPWRVFYNLVRTAGALRMNLEPSVCKAVPSRLITWLIFLCLSVIGQTAFARQPLVDNDGARFIGTWELVSVEAHWPDGHVTSPWGTHPPGRLIYTKEGRMLVLCMHERRNEATRRVVPPALQNEAAGYFDTYKVDATLHIVSHTVAATLRPAESGTIDRTYEFKSGKLYLIAKAARNGLPVTYVLVWKRA
jgi:hypothetical protein